MNLLLPLATCLFILISCAPKESEIIWDAELETMADSRYLLKNQLDSSIYYSLGNRYVKRSKRAIKTKKEALNYGKKIFWRDFGKEYNIEDRRFKVHLVKGYWIVKGLLPIGYSGGALIAIVDSETGKLTKSLIWK
ncbi:MAG: hypothetical protein HKO66_16780 [Saprospiraceae bacterium]|nr:hypothetical protein [Bacteroidia bacterium]NNL93901.1 hypothetical protein [Saprospiraceae bacterium]